MRLDLSETELSSVGGPLPVHGGPERSRKVEKQKILSACLSWDTSLLLSSTWDFHHQSPPVLSLYLNHQSPDAQTFRLRYRQLSWVFRLQPTDCGPSLPP